MSITRDQLRAARVLLHLQQKHLAALSMVSLSTIRRFEGGTDIGPLHADALRRTLVDAGVVFIDGDEDGIVEVPSAGVGVVLRAASDLPEVTRLRIEADESPSQTDTALTSSETGSGGRKADPTQPAVDEENAPIRADEGATVAERGTADATSTGRRKPRRRRPAPV